MAPHRGVISLSHQSFETYAPHCDPRGIYVDRFQFYSDHYIFRSRCIQRTFDHKHHGYKLLRKRLAKVVSSQRTQGETSCSNCSYQIPYKNNKL